MHFKLCINYRYKMNVRFYRLHEFMFSTAMLYAQNSAAEIPSNSVQSIDINSTIDLHNVIFLICVIY